MKTGIFNKFFQVLSSCLILLLIFSTNLVKISSADIPSPESNMRFEFSSSDQSEIKVYHTVNGSTIIYTFNSPLTVTSDKIVENDRPPSEAETIKMYKLSDPSFTCKISTGSPMGAILERDFVAYQLVYKTPNYSLFRNYGLYITNDQNKFLRVDKAELNSCNLQQLYTFENDMNTNFTSSDIVQNLTSEDKDKMCSRIPNNWEDFKNNARNLLIPSASTNSLWREGNSSDAESLNDVAKPIIEAFNLAGDNDWKDIDSLVKLYSSSGNNLSGSYVLTDTGKQVLASTAQLAKNIKEDIETLQSSGNGWPCPENQLVKFKWSKTFYTDTGRPTEYYTNIDEFKASIDKVVQFIGNAASNLSTPAETKEDICDGIKGAGGILSFGVVAMIQQVFCAMIIVLKDAVDAFYGFAITLLNMSIGIEYKDYNIEEKGSSSSGPSSYQPNLSQSLSLYKFKLLEFS